MNRRTKNLAYAAGAFLLALYLAWTYLGVAPATETELSPWVVSSVTPEAPSDDPAARVATGPASEETKEPLFIAGRRSYALSMGELSGLPLDTPPGTELELWVAWDPPVTKRPEVQLLLEDVLLEKMIPGMTPEAPGVAVIVVRDRDVSDLFWGDRYGALSAVVVR